jgi:hypothetical protein
MRRDILNLAQDQEIETSFKFVDRYLEAAQLINEQEHDPFDNIILNLSVSNSKSRDFLDFIKDKCIEKPEFIIEYTNEGLLQSANLSVAPK